MKKKKQKHLDPASSVLNGETKLREIEPCGQEISWMPRPVLLLQHHSWSQKCRLRFISNKWTERASIVLGSQGGGSMEWAQLCLHAAGMPERMCSEERLFMSTWGRNRSNRGTRCITGSLGGSGNGDMQSSPGICYLRALVSTPAPCPRLTPLNTKIYRYSKSSISNVVFAGR